MTFNDKVYLVFRNVSVVLLVLWVSTPLFTLMIYTTMAFPATAIQQQSQETTIKQTVPNVRYLNENADRLPSENKAVYDTYTVSERNARGLPTVLPSLQPYYGEKSVYLTFDDGPDPDNTPVILDILRNNGIKATFFVVGEQVEKHPDILMRTYSEGHAIGNHSYNHIYDSLYRSAGSYINQLHQTDDIIKKVIQARPRISRAPGGSAGSFTKEYWESLKNEGYIEVGWNVSSGDASKAKAQQIVNNIIRQMDAKFLWSHAIVLMHDGRGHGETAKALPEIIRFFKESGFEFRVVNTETPPAW